MLNSDGTKLYFIAPNGAGTALWEQDLKERRTTMKAPLGWVSFNMDKEGKNAYYPQGNIGKLELASGRTSQINFSTFYTERRPKSVPTSSTTSGTRRRKSSTTPA